MTNGKIKKAVIREDLLSITKDYKEAVILNQFIYWSERVSDADVLIAKENEIAQRNGEEEREPLYGWIYKTAEELADEVMLGLSASQIRRYISNLVEYGYISKRNNPKYKWDRTLQYKVNLVNIARALKKNGYPLSEYKIDIPDDETPIAHGCAINKASTKNQSCFGERAIPEITTENTNKDYKYAFPESKDSEKGYNIYASFSEKKEAGSRYIPDDYSYEELREHIKPIYDQHLKEKCGYGGANSPVNVMLDITIGFYRMYERETGHKHKVLSDTAYRNIADCFMNPPDVICEKDVEFDFDCHMEMAEQYFKTEYNKRGKYKGEVEKSLSHFMSGFIRENLFYRTCY